jgi:hypothetical protein
MRTLHYLIPLVLGAGALVASAAGCELIAAPDRSLIGAAGAGGGMGGSGGTGGDVTTGGGSGGTGGSMGGSGGTGGSMLMNGAPCADASQCMSGFCTDGVCCDLVCDQPCDSCTAALKGGGNDGECGQSAGGTVCGDVASCAGGTATLADQCDGSGMCVDGGTMPCDPFICDAGGVMCLSMCGSDTDCATGNYCLANSCVPQKANGLACTGINECQSGFCVDGFCCNSDCTGTCQACSNAKKGAGPNGTCGNINNNQDPDNECAAGDCLTGSCNGMGACGVQAMGTNCGDAQSCMTGTQTNQDTCDAMGVCVDNGTMACGNYNCNGAGTLCLTMCNNNNDCVAPATCQGGMCL